MASQNQIFLAIGIAVMIIVGAAVGLLYIVPLSPGHNNNSGLTTSSKSTSSSSSHSSSASGSAASSSSSSTSSVTSSTSSSSSSSSSSSNSSYCVQNCSFELVQQGSGPVLYSPMTTPMSQTGLIGNGPCCGGDAEINYTDNGYLWTLQGDIEDGSIPNSAFAVANSSGLTVTYNSCGYGYIKIYNTTWYNCGPHREYFQPEPYYDSAIYGDLGAIPRAPSKQDRPLSLSLLSFGGFTTKYFSEPILSQVPSNATVFSIVVNLPYHDYFNSCPSDTGSNSSDPLAPIEDGCSYEFTPYDSASLGFDVGGNYDVVNIAQVCPCTSTSNSLQMSAYTSNGGSSIVQVLNTITVPYNYTPIHKLTIATDRKTFIDFYVDNTLLYSNTIMPIMQNPAWSGVIEFTMRTSINHEADVVTFGNANVYASHTISATGLPPGAIFEVKGSDGFEANATADSTGTAIVDVAAQPTGLSAEAFLNGQIIGTYDQQSLDAGAILTYVSGSSSSLVPFLPLPGSSSSSLATTYSATTSLLLQISQIVSLLPATIVPILLFYFRRKQKLPLLSL